GSCYILTTESIRREVIDVVPQTTLAGCKLICNANTNCQATLLNDAGDACVLLGATSADPNLNSCPVPFSCHVKMDSGCSAIPQRPIGSDYTLGECSGPSDIVGDLATDGN
ncbi:hypothetical protein PMAYCL1PPCAC_31995, partial [Pristionchus mayeri]